MNTLITGANGFVGQALCKYIAQSSSFGKTIAVSRRELPESSFSKNLEHHIIPSLNDLSNHTELLADVDCVIHLAARVHQMDDQSENPLAEFRAVNTEATCLLAKAAVASGVRRFVYLSSIKVLGEGSTASKYTEKSPENPVDPYALSKWEAEQQLQEIAKETGLEVVIIRPPLVYGENVKANFQKILKAIYRGIPLPISRIENRRSFIYVENLADAILTVSSHPQAPNQTFLVSDGEDVSTPQLAVAIGKGLQKSAKLFPLPVSLLKIAGRLTGRTTTISRLTDSLSIDSSKIQDTLNWKPPFTFGDGILKTSQWFLENHTN